MEESGSDSDDQVDPKDGDGIFELIRRVESHPAIYQSRDPKHSRKDSMNLIWKSIANGLVIGGRTTNGTWCKRKWKKLKDYYFKVKKAGKGKSGDRASSKKIWAYYNAIDRVLSSVCEENENTQSNFPGDDSDYNPSPQTSRPNTPADGMASGVEVESTPVAVKSTTKDRRRKAEETEQLVSEKILKILEEPEEVKDQFYYFGMTVSNKLREMPPEMSDFAMMRLMNVLYEITNPPPPPMRYWEGPPSAFGANDEEPPQG